MNKKIIFFLILFLFLATLLAIVLIYSKPTQKSNKIQVITTLFPLYDFAKNIGGEKAQVNLLLPPGIEAHAFEPKPSDLVKINNADIFIYTGEFMEPWAKDITTGVSSKTKIVNASTNIDLIPEVFHDADEPAGSMDPHIWLDFENDYKMIDTITNAFITKDGANTLYYQTNASALKQKLALLDEQYQSTLAHCAQKEIIYGGHYAFGYLAKRYHLEYLSAQGISPNSEPTAKDLITLTTQIKKNKINYIFYEELSSPKIAEIIANETNAKMLLLNAAHNITKNDMDKNINFIQIMQKNLENLKIGLNCNQYAFNN